MKPTCPSCNADAPDDGRIRMHPLLTAQGEAFIHLSHGTELRAQLTPAQIRQHAMYLLECAEAAESDAMVFRLLREKLDLGIEQAVRIIADLRNYRDDKYRKPETA